jgi:hypothetical protein
MNKENDFYKTKLNLSKYHREHEKYYAWEPLEKSIKLQRTSIIMKTLADRWKNQSVNSPKKGNPYMGCEDLNETSLIQHTGVLFMEGEGEPPEISRIKKDLKILSKDFLETGEWLSKAMDSSWIVADKLVKNPQLADVLGERHRIIINDWEAANLSILISNLISRAIDIFETIDFTPDALRKNLKGPNTVSDYLYSASELIDHAADMASKSAMLVHDNERRWRVFREKIHKIKNDEEVKSNE